jgi:antitoxin (DNA-binding transcriptional repressor) of toxin-antitoxin stability system
VLARASQKQVVNVAQHGGLCAVLVCHSRPEVGVVTAEHRAPSLVRR